jgi:hypothetical protein
VISYISAHFLYPVGGGPKVLAHVCNDMVWSQGLTADLSKRWPEVKEAYETRKKLVVGITQEVQVAPDWIVVNMVVQSGLGAMRKAIRLDALVICLEVVAEIARRTHSSVHLPRFSSPRGDTPWEEIEPLLRVTLKGLEVFVYDPNLPEV